LIHIFSEKISYFQLKNSNIKTIQAKEIKPIYQSSHFILINAESIYSIENNIKNDIEYIIANGNMATSNGTGEYECVYSNSIPKAVSLPYICHHKKAQIYHIKSIKINEITVESI
jgi:hypothetical protein